MTNQDLIQIGEEQANWNVAGTRILKHSVEMYHKGLKEHKLISSPDIEILEKKVELQKNKWVEKWDTVETKRKIKEEKEADLEEANNRTKEAQAALKEIDNLLIFTLSIDDTVDWESLKKNDNFETEKPQQPKKKKQKAVPPKPDQNSLEFIPRYTLIEKIFKSRKQKKANQYEFKYNDALKNWEKQKEETEIYNSNIEQENEDNIKKWEKEVEDWEKEKELFYIKQKEFNSKIDQLKASYFEKDVNSITEYCEMVLNNSEYPETFPNNFEIEYNPENKILIVEYQLPGIECFPIVKEVKYIATKKELRESTISESQIKKMFDDAMYKIALRSVHELFEADTANAIMAVSFNGWINAINKATGKEENNCILSIQVSRDEFMQIELANVDPKICFKNLKGVASSKLSALTPIKPILQISKADKRFIDSYDVTDKIDDSTNIAAMDWEDFEHLIREIFEKEFSVGGGEVKVTQASRDGGVDAIAFDPDPIRGGKIVIQAKRYTNVVGVAAVRDLYGTVVNEGATKGILVTTADYGPDAYEFAKDKPLTLLSGSNLLHLLSKHGHHAKIDIKEAKKLLAEKEKSNN